MLAHYGNDNNYEEIGTPAENPEVTKSTLKILVSEVRFRLKEP